MGFRVPSLPVQYVSGLDGLASIAIDHGVILMDERVKAFPDIVWDFIYFHELYHLFYNTPLTGRSIDSEIKCDLGAVDELLMEGASKPQIMFAMDVAISDPKEREIRKTAVNNYLSKMKII